MPGDNIGMWLLLDRRFTAGTLFSILPPLTEIRPHRVVVCLCKQRVTDEGAERLRQLLTDTTDEPEL